MDKLIRIEEVMGLYGIESRTTAYRWESLGLIPTSVKIGAAKRWRESDVRAHIAQLNSRREIDPQEAA